MAAVLGALTACTGPRLPPPSTDIDESGLRDAVRILAADEFEGRRPGTAGEDKTVAYLVAQFRKLGCKPGNGDSFVQPVPLVEIQTGSDAFLSISGGPVPTALLFAKDMVIWSPREQPDAALHGSALVFAGYGIVAPEHQWNDYAGADVRGKTVLVLAGDPRSGPADPKSFAGETYYGTPAYKFEEAARQGAVGVLIIHEISAAGVPWAAVVNDGTGPRIEAASADGNARRAAIEGWVTGAAARGMFAQAGLDYAMTAAAAARPGFHAVTLGLAADAGVHDSVRPFMSANVIAVVPGSKRRREYVIYTAHWDGLGRRGDAILNGAVDDAAGVAGLLMLAQSVTRTRPAAERAFAFIAFTGGASGLLGSRYYTEHAPLPLRDTVGVLNVDRPPLGGPTRDVLLFGAGNSELEDYLRAAALLQGREVRPDPNPQRGLYYRSDQLSFARAGVPALYAQAGLDDAARGPAWGQAQREDYLLHRYHQAGDKYSADWDVRGILEDLRLYAEVGTRLAHGRRFPRWYPGSEFRSDRSPGLEAPAE